MSAADGKWVEAEKLIPHRQPFKMLDAAMLHSAGYGVGTVVLNDGHPGVADGLVLEAAMVECVAQTAAAMEGLRFPPAEGAKIGMLCGVSEFHVVRRPPAGRKLTIRVWEEKRIGPLSLARGEIICDGTVAAGGQLKLYAGEP